MKVVYLWYFIIKSLDAGNGTLDWSFGESTVESRIEKLESLAEARSELLREAQAAPADDIDI